MAHPQGMGRIILTDQGWLNSATGFCAPPGRPGTGERARATAAGPCKPLFGYAGRAHWRKVWHWKRKWKGRGKGEWKGKGKRQRAI